MKTYVSPSGNMITGTLEMLMCEASINGINDDGTPVYSGSTNVFWDDQAPVLKDGKIVYIDEADTQWTFDQLTPVVDEDAEEEPVPPPFDLKLVRTETDQPVPSHGGNAVGVTWQLLLNGVEIDRAYDRYRWETDPKRRAMCGEKPPHAMRLRYEALIKSMEK